MDAMRFAVCSCVVLGALAPGPRAAEEDATDAPVPVDVALERILDGVREGAWQRASEDLAALVATTYGEGPRRELLLHRDRILRALRHCALRLAVAEEPLADVLSGELVSWSEATGRAVLRYRPDTTDDLTQTDTLFVTDFVLEGEVRVTVRGSSYAGGGPVLLVSSSDVDVIQAAFGGVERDFWFPAKEPTVLFTIADDEWVEYGSSVEDLPRLGDPYELSLTADGERVVIRHGSDAVIRWSHPGHDWVSVAASPPRGWEELEFAVRTDGHWFRSLVDDATLQRERAWERGADVEERLPAWFRDAPEPDWIDTGSAGLQALPWSISNLAYDDVTEAARLVDSDPRACLDFIQDEGQLWEPGLRSFLCGEALYALGDFEPAGAHYEAAFADEPGYAQARNGLLLCLIAQDREAEITRRSAEFLTADPRHVTTRMLVAVAHQFLGDRAGMTAVLRDARRLGVHDVSLRDMESVQQVAELGPAFTRRFVHASEHYEVITDVDADAARHVAGELERARTLACRWLGTPPDTAARPVLLFAGRSRYRDHARDLGGLAHFTAGLYAARTQQILLHNATEAIERDDSARHEAVHELADALALGLPQWLGEGLAMLVAEETRLTDLGPLMTSPDAVAWLLDEEWLPFEDLLEFEHDEFQAHAELAYVQSWALLRALHHEQPELFERVLEAIRDDRAWQVAFVIAEELPLHTWEATAREHLQGMR